jgi:hypothetical protein
MTAGGRSTRTSPRAGAAEFIRARTRWDLLRTHGTDAPQGGSPDGNGAPSPVEQTKRFSICRCPGSPGFAGPGGQQVRAIP